MNNIFHNPDLQRIEFLDSRYYTLDGVNFVPSVTAVLGSYPKNEYFYQWLRNTGDNSHKILEEASREGTQIHGLVEDYVAGKECTWADENGVAKYNLSVWSQFLKFVEFWDRYKPRLIHSELKMVSMEYGLGGTTDLICELNGEIWMLDVKSSNYQSPTWELQLAKYTDMYNSLFGKRLKEPVTKYGIIWTKALTRGEDKKGKKMQGKGWQIVTFDRPHEEALKVFDAVHLLWKQENPNYKPHNLILPDRVKMSA